MRPTGPEVKEASVSLVGVTEAGGAHFMAEERPAVDAPPTDGRTNGTITVTAVYTVKPDGAIAGDWTLDASDAMPAAIPWGFKSLPRAGVHVALPAGYDRATWYGRGPHECYVDRADAAHVDTHSATLDELHVPYVYPGKWLRGEKTNKRRHALASKKSSHPFPPTHPTPHRRIRRPLRHALAGPDRRRRPRHRGRHPGRPDPGQRVALLHAIVCRGRPRL